MSASEEFSLEAPWTGLIGVTIIGYGQVLGYLVMRFSDGRSLPLDGATVLSGQRYAAILADRAEKYEREEYERLRKKFGTDD